MNESSINPDPPKRSALNDFYVANQTILDRVLFVLITAIVGAIFHVKLDTVETKTDDAAVKAGVATTQAAHAAEVGERNEKLNTAALQAIAKQTDDPQAKAVVKEVKAEQATTNQPEAK